MRPSHWRPVLSTANLYNRWKITHNEDLYRIVENNSFVVPGKVSEELSILSVWSLFKTVFKRR